MHDKDTLVQIFALRIQHILKKTDFDFGKLQEIRLRAGRPLLVFYDGKEVFLDEKGRRCRKAEQAYQVRKREVTETMEYIGNYSLYAFEEELKQGFLTIQGGHRVGVAGRTVIDGDKVKGMKYISNINVRLSHQIKGCADEVIPYLWKDGQVCHTLIISPPRCGKTTLLRDIIRQLSDGSEKYPGKTVGVVDERSEIGGAYMGVIQNDLGIRTDLLDCCPKAEGMMMMIRSMSPEVVCVDEIGDQRDMHAIEAVIHCGCRLIATVHGSSIEDINQKPLLQKLVKEKVFERFIVLSGKTGVVQSIFDERGTALYRKKVVL